MDSEQDTAMCGDSAHKSTSKVEELESSKISSNVADASVEV